MYGPYANVIIEETNEIVGTGWLPPMPDMRDYPPDHPDIKSMGNKLGLSKARAHVLPTKVDLRQWCSPIENHRRAADQKFLGNQLGRPRLWLAAIRLRLKQAGSGFLVLAVDRLGRYQEFWHLIADSKSQTGSYPGEAGNEGAWLLLDSFRFFTLHCCRIFYRKNLEWTLPSPRWYRVSVKTGHVSAPLRQFPGCIRW
jgi:hypothetical protein